jgi:hypothetical protein
MKKRLILSAAVMLMLISSSAVAQRGYTEFKTEEGVAVMYRWQRAQFFNRDSDAVLNLRVTNENEYPVNWTYSVIFYHDKMAMHESADTTLCIQPGQSKRGAFAGLRYTVDGLKLSDVESDIFEWEFSVFDVEEVEDCND